jgi:hypothetical protein
LKGWPTPAVLVIQGGAHAEGKDDRCSTSPSLRDTPYIRIYPPCKIRHVLIYTYPDIQCVSYREGCLYEHLVDNAGIVHIYHPASCSLPHPCKKRRSPLDCHCHPGVTSRIEGVITQHRAAAHGAVAVANIDAAGAYGTTSASCEVRPVYTQCVSYRYAFIFTSCVSYREGCLCTHTHTSL